MAEQKYSALFSDPDADVIFRSSDGIDFRLHKLILHKASPIFRDMFALPDEPSRLGVPQIVAMPENATTLHKLLTYCYPMQRTEFVDLDRLVSVLRATIKYDLAFLVETLRHRLEQFVFSEPTRVLLNDPFFSDPLIPPPEFDRLPARALSLVGAYRRQCTFAAKSKLFDFNWMYHGEHGRGVGAQAINTSTIWAWLACLSCARGAEGLTVVGRVNARQRDVWPRAWWQTYADAAARELALRPLGVVVTKLELMRPAVAEAAKCTQCAPRAMADLVEYADAVARRIDEATSQVEIQLPFA